jgi:hypothetical protein
MRAAWIDEQLDAEARADVERATIAAALVAECDRRIEALHHARDRGLFSWLGARVAALLH